MCFSLCLKQRLLQEQIVRDRNHPSVVMWSIGNEPKSYEAASQDYFQEVADFTRTLDPSRPVTLVINVDVGSDLGAYAVDVICINRYFGWYSDNGRIDRIERQMSSDLAAWRAKHNKPIIVSEYGADTIHGFHETPSNIFTEEFQTDFMSEYFKSFDGATGSGGLIGELIWNFADFMTKDEFKRVWGNRKGVFTRDRHPKSSAHLLRARYWSMVERDLRGELSFYAPKEEKYVSSEGFCLV